jgi:hypothetical protein
MIYIVTIGQRKHAVLKLAELFCAMHSAFSAGVPVTIKGVSV